MIGQGAGKIKEQMEQLKALEAKLDIYKSTLTEIYEQYDQKLEELSLVRRMGDALRATMSLESLSRALLETVAHEVAVDRLALMRSDPDRGDQLAIIAVYEAETFSFHENGSALWPLSTLGLLAPEGGLTTPLTFLSAEASYDPLGRPGEAERSLVFLPLMIRSRLLGVLLLSRPASRPFAPEDERLLAIMADQASSALSSVLLFDDLTKVNLRLTISERRARAASEYMQRLLEDANDAVVILDEGGLVAYANRKAERWGWPKAELRGKNFRDLFEETEGLAGAWPPGAPPATDRIFEAVLINAAGERRDVMLSTSSVSREGLAAEPGRPRTQGRGAAMPDQPPWPGQFDESGAELPWKLENAPPGRAWMILASDLTERKQLERQLIHSEKLASIGLLAAGVAHEVGNPLSAISGYAQIMESGDVTEADRREYLAAILNQTTRIQKILRELLDFSRPSRGIIEQIDLAEAVQRILSMLTGQRAFSKIKLDYRLDEKSGPHSVSMDRDHLAQVVIIIAMNAAQAMGGEGRLEVALSREPGWVSLSIKDDGPGMSPEVRARVFDPFFTTKNPGEGTGLGLAICQRIVDSYRGRLSLKTAPGQGAAFTISWPSEEAG